MIPTRPSELHRRRLRLAREPAAAGGARSQVRALIRAWKIPVDPGIAVLLASDLVTHAITRGAGETVTPAGEAACFTLAFQPGLPPACDPAAAGDTWRLPAVPGLARRPPLVAHPGTHTQLVKRQRGKHYAQESARTAEVRFLLD